MGYILGIDEAGRGAWAGPLVVGAVILGDYRPEGLTDSKLLTRPLRHRFSGLIRANAVSVGLGWVEPGEIDRLGLTEATLLGINRALEGMERSDNEIIIDGNINYLKSHPNSRCLIKADKTVAEVSAAGVIAKVARDEYMDRLSKKYPVYGFDKHVGYGTKKHSQTLKNHGVCREHRVSFKPVAGWV